jgi:hypothetical protein
MNNNNMNNNNMNNNNINNNNMNNSYMNRYPKVLMRRQEGFSLEVSLSKGNT